METGTSFTSLDLEGEDRFQRLRADLGITTFGLNLLRLRPGQRGRIHRHLHQEEAYLVLDGALTLELDGEPPRELRRGDLARVAPEVRRRVSNRGDEPVFVIAIGGAEEHVGRDGRAWTSWDEPGEGLPPQEIPLPDDVR